MLERIREGSGGPVAKIILGLVIATFIFAGVGSYTNSVDTSAASVNGQKISQQQFDQAYQNHRARLKQQFGEMFDQIAGNEAYIQNMRSSVLEQLINEALLDQAVTALDIRVSDEQIKEQIVNMPEFQVAGVFDNNRYLMIINQAGFRQASAFRDYLRTDMARRQLMTSIMASEFNLPYQQNIDSKLTNQTRDIRYAVIQSAPFAAQVEVSEADINEFYESNIQRFATPEEVKVEYVELDIANLLADVDVSDEQVQQFYDNNMSSYSTKERRRLSHILIEFGDDEDAAQQQTQEILAQINAGGDYAELAKEFSADTFTGENGGDLDWVERGEMEGPFEDAAFALSLDNNLSGVVKSEFGFHIIKLTDIEPVQTQAFADVSGDIKAQLQNDQALERFYELQGQMAEVAFESPESLDEVAGVINANIKQSSWLTRGTNMAPFDQASIIEAAFSSEVLQEALNSEVIEVASDSKAMVIRLLEHKKASTMPLADVNAQIKGQLTNQKASQKAQETAQVIADKLVAGEDVAADLAANSVEFVEAANVGRNDATVERNISQQAFLLAHPSEGQVSASTTSVMGGGYAIVEVVKVNEGTVAVADPSISQQQVMAISQATFESVIENLKKDAEITRNLPSSSSQL